MEFTRKLDRLIAEIPEVDGIHDSAWQTRVQKLFDAHEVSRAHPVFWRTEVIFDNLVRLSGLGGTGVELVVVEDESLFPALLFGPLVIIGTSLGRLGVDELAFIIGHELGHFQQMQDGVEGGESVWTPWRWIVNRLNRHELEFEADAYARELVTRAGWEGGGARVLRRMEAVDRRSSVRYGLFRAIPFVGWLIVKWKMLQDRWFTSHPSVESRMIRLGLV